MLVGGLFFATLAMAAVEAQLPMEVPTGCDARGEGCVADEQLFPPTDELQGLDLLQVEVRLQSEAPVASRTVVPKVMPSNAATPKRVEVEIKAAPVSATGVDNEEKLVVSSKSSSSKATSSDLGFRSVVTGTSLFERTSSVHYQNLNNGMELNHAMERFVAGMTLRGGSTIFIVMVLLVLVCMCVMFGLARAEAKTPLSQSPRGSPAAQAILQAPQMTNQHQSPMMASLNKSPMAPVSNPTLSDTGPVSLPPICPSLILPHTEARFMIPFDSLVRASGDLDIRGTSGRKLLHGAINETPEGRRCLVLASCGCEEDPRVTLMAPPRTGSLAPREGEMGTLELYGKGGKFYGTLTSEESGGAVLVCGDQTVMSLEIGGSDMRMTASSMDGRLLASAGKNVQVSVRRLESNDTWKLQVKPNCDAVLIAACMLGVLLFSK